MKIKCNDTKKAEQKIKNLRPQQGATISDRIYIEQKNGECYVSFRSGRRISACYKVCRDENCIILKRYDEDIIRLIFERISMILVCMLLLFYSICIIYTLISRVLELYEIGAASLAAFMLIVIFWIAYLGPKYNIKKYIKKVISED